MEAIVTFVQLLGGPHKPLGHKCDVVGLIYADANSHWQYTASGWKPYLGDQPQGMVPSVYGEYELYVPADKVHEFAMELDELAAQLTAAMKHYVTGSDIVAIVDGKHVYKWTGDFEYVGTCNKPSELPDFPGHDSCTCDEGVFYVPPTYRHKWPNEGFMYQARMETVVHMRKSAKLPCYPYGVGEQFVNAAKDFAAAMRTSFMPVPIPDCSGVVFDNGEGCILEMKDGEWKPTDKVPTTPYWVSCDKWTLYISEHRLPTFYACAMAIGVSLTQQKMLCVDNSSSSKAELKFQEIVRKLAHRDDYAVAWLQDADGLVYSYCDGKWGVAIVKPMGEFQSYQYVGFTFGFKAGVDCSKALADFEAQILGQGRAS